VPHCRCNSRPFPPPASSRRQIPGDRGAFPQDVVPVWVFCVPVTGYDLLARLNISMCTQERPGLVVLMIELESALAQMPSNTEPTKMWSPYREPLARFLNKYPEEVLPFCPS
jgi:hypothetical protein